MVSHAVLLGPLDRITGAAFAVAKYFLLVSLLLNLYIAVFPSARLSEKSHLCGGRVVLLTARFAPWVLGALSPFVTGDDGCHINRIDKAPQPTETTI